MRLWTTHHYQRKSEVVEPLPDIICTALTDMSSYTDSSRTSNTFLSAESNKSTNLSATSLKPVLENRNTCLS